MEPWRQKVPLSRSLHGSNDLRGGQRIFDSNVLVDNWFDDRLSPVNAQPLTSCRVYHPLYRSTPIASKRETTYVQTYDYGDWRRRPFYLSKYGLLGHDESGSDTWTTETRSQFENPALRKVELERMGYWPYEGSIYPKQVRGAPGFTQAHLVPIRLPDIGGQHLSKPTRSQEFVHRADRNVRATGVDAPTDDKPAIVVRDKLPLKKAEPEAIYEGTRPADA